MKTKEKIEARRIRVEEQLSLKDIAERLGVSKGTASLWVRDLPLSQKTVESRSLRGSVKGAKTRRDDAMRIRVDYQNAGREMARKYKDDPLFMAGCMMHWAEGTKNKNMVGICNTDFYFMKLWLKFIRRFFDIEVTDMALSVHCYLDNGKTLRQIETYWLEKLVLPRSCLRQTVVVTNHRFSTGAKKNKHPYGVALIRIYSTEVVQKIWGAIKFFADIKDEDKWLD